MKLYGYEIYDKCTHKQIRSIKIDSTIDPKDTFIQKMKKLDESSWCIKFLVEYKGKLTLEKFLRKNIKLKTEQVYSLILQIIKIHMILYDGGYIHGDMHAGNIMINKTDKKYFILNNKKIPYYGYQLSAIDYGFVMNAKFKIKYDSHYDLFIKKPEIWLFNEIKNDIMNFISNESYKIYCCKKLKEKLPWEKNENIYSEAILKILNNNTDFFIQTSKKYIKISPDGKKLIEKLVKNRKTIKSLYDITKNNKNMNSYLFIINMISREFELKYPKLDKQYFGWCCECKWLLSDKESLNFLLLTNTKELINYATTLIL